MGRKYTEAQKRASMKYMKEKTDDIRIRPKKGTQGRWKEEAESRNKSLNQFIIDCVEGEITRTGEKQSNSTD